MSKIVELKSEQIEKVAGGAAATSAMREVSAQAHAAHTPHTVPQSQGQMAQAQAKRYY